MSWRDKGWNNPHKLPSDWFIYEAGADAMHKEDVDWIRGHFAFSIADKRTGIVCAWFTCLIADWEDFIEEDNEKNAIKKES